MPPGAHASDYLAPGRLTANSFTLPIREYRARLDHTAGPTTLAPPVPVSAPRSLTGRSGRMSRTCP